VMRANRVVRKRRLSIYVKQRRKAIARNCIVYLIRYDFASMSDKVMAAMKPV
jgi:hypothetical protein